MFSVLCSVRSMVYVFCVASPILLVLYFVCLFGVLCVMGSSFRCIVCFMYVLCVLCIVQMSVCVFNALYILSVFYVCDIFSMHVFCGLCMRSMSSICILWTKCTFYARIL